MLLQQWQRVVFQPKLKRGILRQCLDRSRHIDIHVVGEHSFRIIVRYRNGEQNECIHVKVRQDLYKFNVFGNHCCCCKVNQRRVLLVVDIPRNASFQVISLGTTTGFANCGHSKLGRYLPLSLSSILRFSVEWSAPRQED